MQKSNYKMSLNPIAVFTTATEGKKRSLVKQQKNPSPVFVARYRTARASMLRSIKNGLSEAEIQDGICRLTQKVPETKFQAGDKTSSIAALEAFLRLAFPAEFTSAEISFPTSKVKVLPLAGVDILVSPDLIIKWNRDGRNVIGGIKFRISKSGGFDIVNSKCAAAGLRLFLESFIAEPDEVVDPRLCLSIDVFEERITSAPLDSQEYIDKLITACNELKRIWDAA